MVVAKLFLETVVTDLSSLRRISEQDKVLPMMMELRLLPIEMVRCDLSVRFREIKATTPPVRLTFAVVAIERSNELGTVGGS